MLVHSSYETIISCIVINEDLAKITGMIPLKDELKKLLLKGDTSLDEIYKNIITLDN